MSYVLVDHGLTPFSPIEEVDRWIERVKRMIEENPNNNELREALMELERLRGLVRGEEPG
jgi:hypothetical protein